MASAGFQVPSGWLFLLRLSDRMCAGGEELGQVRDVRQAAANSRGYAYKSKTPVCGSYYWTPTFSTNETLGFQHLNLNLGWSFKETKEFKCYIFKDITSWRDFCSNNFHEINYCNNKLLIMGCSHTCIAHAGNIWLDIWKQRYLF